MWHTLDKLTVGGCMCICPFSVSTTYLQYNLGKFIIYLQEMYHVKKKKTKIDHLKITKKSYNILFFFFFTRHRPCKNTFKRHWQREQKFNSITTKMHQPFLGYSLIFLLLSLSFPSGGWSTEIVFPRFSSFSFVQLNASYL